ncbi:hypothetical protein RKE29_11240, partial [Streptomyces sp. B1866]|nr:hypothetical protein [Streptomyces sp. B1866]
AQAGPEAPGGAGARPDRQAAPDARGGPYGGGVPGEQDGPVARAGGGPGDPSVEPPAAARVRRWRPTARVLADLPAGRAAGLAPGLLADADAVADTPPPWPLRLAVVPVAASSQQAARLLRGVLGRAFAPSAPPSARPPVTLLDPGPDAPLTGASRVLLAVEHAAYAAMAADPSGADADGFRRAAGRARDAAGLPGTVVVVVSRAGEGWFHPGNLRAWCVDTLRALLGRDWPGRAVLPVDLGPHGSGGEECARLVAERWGDPALPAELTADRLRGALTSLRLTLRDEADRRAWPDPLAVPRLAAGPALELPRPGEPLAAAGRVLWDRLVVHACARPASEAAAGLATAATPVPRARSRSVRPPGPAAAAGPGGPDSAVRADRAARPDGGVRSGGPAGPGSPVTRTAPVPPADPSGPDSAVRPDWAVPADRTVRPDGGARTAGAAGPGSPAAPARPRAPAADLVRPEPTGTGPGGPAPARSGAADRPEPPDRPNRAERPR